MAVALGVAEGTVVFVALGLGVIRVVGVAVMVGIGVNKSSYPSIRVRAASNRLFVSAVRPRELIWLGVRVK